MVNSFFLYMFLELGFTLFLLALFIGVELGALSVLMAVMTPLTDSATDSTFFKTLSVFSAVACSYSLIPRIYREASSWKTITFLPLCSNQSACIKERLCFLSLRHLFLFFCFLGSGCAYPFSLTYAWILL